MKFTQRLTFFNQMDHVKLEPTCDCQTKSMYFSGVKTYKNEILQLNGVLRQEMGSYLCIASNGVPPSVSKRYYVNVLCEFVHGHVMCMKITLYSYTFASYYQSVNLYLEFFSLQLNLR